jgi:hypothetical protein
MSSRSLKALWIISLYALWSLSALCVAHPLSAYAATTASMGEGQHIHITVHNHTDDLMRLTGSNLSWGKWGQSPVDIEPHSHIQFDSMGRENSPSGTTGWATWHVEGYSREPIITVSWDDPYTGSNSGNIVSNPANTIPISGYVPSSGSDIQASFTVGPED